MQKGGLKNKSYEHIFAQKQNSDNKGKVDFLFLFSIELKKIQ